MKNLIKKLSVTVSLIGSLVFSASAVNITITMPPNSCSNLLGTSFSGYALVTAASLTSSTNIPVVSFYDGVTNTRAIVQGAYTNQLSYLTNRVAAWTNYFGAVNTYTNTELHTEAQVVAATTNNAPLLYTISAPAGTTVTASPLSIPVTRGLWVTNGTTNMGTLTLSIIQ